MQFFLTKGLTQTASLWSDVQLGYAWVHRAAHILSHDEKQTAAQVRQAEDDASQSQMGMLLDQSARKDIASRIPLLAVQHVHDHRHKT
jgi:hypothetical protein